MVFAETLDLVEGKVGVDSFGPHRLWWSRQTMAPTAHATQSVVAKDREMGP